jgi:uncharacterized protein (DUF885 family)
MTSSRVLLGYAALCIGGACASAQEIADLYPAVRAFEADQSTIRRAYDMRWSEFSSDRTEQLYRAWQTNLNGTNFAALSQNGKIDYILLRNEFSGGLSRLTLDRQRLHDIEELIPFRAVIQELERSRWEFHRVAPQDAASKLSEVPAQVKKIRERLEKAKKSKDDKKNGDAKKNEGKEEVAPLKLAPAMARRAANAVNDIRGTLKAWYSFYDGFQPEFSWWLKKPYDEASSAMEGYAKFLNEEIAELKGKDEDPLIGESIGREALMRDISNEMLSYTPEELISIGEKEFTWCEGEMKKAALEMGFDDWLQALAKVKSAFVPPGEQDELVAGFAQEATEFVNRHDLVTIPPLCADVWRLTMLSPDSQKSIPYVAYGGGSILVAYAREDMKHEDKLMAMRGNNRHFTRITTAHELLPGHHLQAFNAARHREYRRLFSTPFFVEGWALYWEMRLWELNYATTPQDRIGMLFWRMHRAARIIVSLKFHLGQMQPKEMVEFLTKRVGHEKFGATSEVRRFIAGDYSPLYQCGYMIGGMQLRSLQREATAGGKMTERQFHDAVLTYGPIPVEMIRAGLLNLELSPEYKSQWRFAE